MRTYRTILSLPGTLAFSSSGWLARMPMAMVSIGLVLLVSQVTGSYALAGWVSASYVIVASVAAPLQARMVDRFGQSRVLPILASGYALAIGGVIVVVEIGAPSPIPQLLAGLAGACSPMIGSYVRARWTRLLEGKPELQTAFALEAMLDEVCFMVGPPAVTLLATGISPVLGLVSAIACSLVGTMVLAAQKHTQPPPRGRLDRSGERLPLGWGTLAPVSLACIGLGVIFGGVEVVVVAFTTELHARGLSGVLLGIWAAGSMLAALILGAVKLKASPMTRFQIGAVAMGVAMVPLPFVDNMVVMGVLLFFAGFAISPTMIASVGIVERTVPSSRMSEGIAWVTSALIVGVALGAALVGPVIDRSGASTAFFVPLASGVFAAVTALVSAKVIRFRAVRREARLENAVG